MKEPRKRAPLRARFGLTMVFTAAVFTVLVVTALLMALAALVAYRLGFINVMSRRGPLFLIMLLLLVSVLVGTLITICTSRFSLRPIRYIIQAINRLAGGDFSTRIHFSQPPEAAELAESFNSMAQELGNVELLRTDFVDNFSHEFKTPIVSIKGFAEMLKYCDLTQDERDEYLDIVISESSRLARLATNALDLSKIEKQEILSGQSRFCVSEQIRQSVILLQPKWEERGMTIAVDGADIDIVGNEEMLSQVWVNLLDNAVKYSPENGVITISFDVKDDFFFYSIHNDGEEIPADAQRRIFDKFYQADISHSACGNGLGLTLVQKIVKLHKGEVTCASDENGTSFTVRMPVSLAA